MGYYCTVPQCTSLAGKTKNVKFHRFPRDVTMADKWNLILKRGKPYTKYSKVCSLHFTQADYNATTMGQWKTLSKDAVPSQNLPKLNPDGTVMVIRKSRTVKYKEGKKEEIVGNKTDKWQVNTVTHTTAPVNTVTETPAHSSDAQEATLSFRLQALNALASNISPQHQIQQMKPKKQDAFMQTDPVLSEEEENHLNNSYSEASENSFNSEQLEYPVTTPYQKDNTEYDTQKSYEPKDYTKPTEDYIPQTNEEYNKEAEKYALERKSHNGYEKPVLEYQKPVIENGYQKIQDIYAFTDKPDFQNRNETYLYQNGFTDSVEMLRNQQHNLQMLQEQHRITENQNFFNESHIKQEIDMGNEDDKYLYERGKEQLNANTVYAEDQRRALEQQRLLEDLQQQVKQEPDATSGCENVMQPQESPYYATNGHNNVSTGVAGGYYEQLARPGPELLIAKQNALAAHTQLWQNTMKRPFFYSESLHYNTSQLVCMYIIIKFKIA